MNLFQKSDQDELKYQAFISKVESIKDTLSPYDDCADLSSLERVKQEFALKIREFYRKDRKLNIGVIGQVKAGKSSFLNTLLFDGKHVLPSAATPKTATLTKIEYGETNEIRVEYYSEEEWAVLEKNARSDAPGSEYEAAREIMKLVREKGIVPQEYIQKHTDSFVFESADDLMEQLNDYVGENGTYTAMVKNVTIYLQRDELKDISVVDTPGLNDAIASRTDRTRQFISVCDVVFFLSRASQFMDQNDMKLLVSQLPQKGVKKLVMICSRFDDGLVDTIFDHDSMEEAIENTKKELTREATGVLRSQKNDTHRDEILKACQTPLFVSSMCWNMSQKDKNLFDRQERMVFDNLNENDDVTQQTLEEIGNMNEVRNIFDQVVEQKEETLCAKAKSFLPTAEDQLAETLAEYRQKAEKTLQILQSGDKVKLAAQKKAMMSQINSIKGDLEDIFSKMLAKMEEEKGRTLQLLRQASHDYATLVEKQGTEVSYTPYRVSDSVWYRPSTWGSGHTEYASHERTYTYIDAGDALENIRCFTNDACSNIEKVFYKTMDIEGTKHELLTIVVENFDPSGDIYDPAFFRLLTAQTLSGVEFPVMRLDVTKQQDQISSQFSGRIENSKERFELQKLMTETMDNMLSIVTDSLVKEIVGFRKEIEKLKTTFRDELLKNIEDEFEQLMVQFEHKEREIHTYEDFLSLLNTIKN